MKRLKLLSFVISGLLAISPSLSYAASADGIVGPSSAKISDAQLRTVRLTQDGSVGNQETHSKYQEAVIRGNVYTCANLAGTSVTTQAGLSGTTPMLTLSNPTGSGRNLVIIEVNVTPTAAPAAAAGFMIAITTTGAVSPISATTSGTVQNALTSTTGLGNAGCFRVATLSGPPTAIRYFGGTTGAAAISGAMFTDPTDGKVIVGPGTAISIQTTSAVVGVGHIMYEEVLQ